MSRVVPMLPPAGAAAAAWQSGSGQGMAAAARGRLDALQAVRAVAALMVVMFHLKTYTLPDQAGVAAPIWPGFSMGYSGVEIFFVLSGFIMVFVHRDDFAPGARGLGRMAAFLRKRVLRIYPFLWIMLCATILLRAVANGSGSLPDARSALAAFTLWPDFRAPVIEVAWSLSFEMLFYLVFALGILSLPLGLAVGLLWFGGSALAAATGYQGRGAEFLLSPYNLLFVFGIAAALGYRRLGRLALPAALAGAALFLAVGLAESYRVVVWDKGLRTLLYGAGATGIVAGLAALDAGGRLRTPGWLRFLGDASYAIYLVHIMAMTVAARVLAASGLAAALPVWATALLLALAAAAAGAAAHLVVERPLLRYLRSDKRKQGSEAGG